MSDNRYNEKQSIRIVPIQKLKLELPLFESVSAGFPSPAEDYMDGRLDLNEYCIRNPSATFFIRVDGQSMQNAGIFDGDIIIVDRSLPPRHNDVIVGIVDGEFILKRYCRQGQYTFLVAENPSYNPIFIGENTEFRVWGVVTNVIHQLK